VLFIAARAPGVGDATMTSTLSRNQLGCEIGQPVESALRPSILDDDVLAVDPLELTQSLPERPEDRG
jgi:hypothetical protein